MIVAWPVLAYLGMTMARFMKPALPNGGWFQLHRILVISSLCFTCLGFLLIFVAFRNAPTQGLITLGENVSVAQLKQQSLVDVCPILLHRMEVVRHTLYLASLSLVYNWQM